MTLLTTNIDTHTKIALLSLVKFLFVLIKILLNLFLKKALLNSILKSYLSLKKLHNDTAATNPKAEVVT